MREGETNVEHQQRVIAAITEERKKMKQEQKDEAKRQQEEAKAQHEAEKAEYYRNNSKIGDYRSTVRSKMIFLYDLP